MKKLCICNFFYFSKLIENLYEFFTKLGKLLWKGMVC